ncbi:nitric-oxide reductase large subunit [Paraburkholderia dinghuensis]|uniref:Nitric-oxide reductase large subunit n=1 Tax=Paraburkholderia dinghuensis TaxID=2305225 RepID=A0A3N6N0D2_9BURK|nr:nitric-oxide reductase large subunit [Paraburkholderia dinghuensis]RQH09624.1 nitric-oxide reductase large subunit [Paraburkholderia dinghuensis]
MQSTTRLWKWLGLICLASFAVLLWLGREIYLVAPPIPSAVVSDSGSVLFTGEQVQRGQKVWLAAGGQQVGTVWGHGSYVAPDWSADWLHREAVTLRNLWAQQQFGKSYEALTPDEQGTLDGRLKREMRLNRYDATSGRITVTDQRAAAILDVSKHYESLFGTDPSFDKLRDQYAMNAGSVPGAADQAALAAFFFWSSWSATTDRPGQTDVTYTNNWPHEPLVANTPTVANGMWSIASVILLLAGIAGLIWYHAAHHDSEEEAPAAPAEDPLFNVKTTPSMRATKKYFYVVIGLMLTQVAMGSLTAHYAVEGHSVFGMPIAEFLPWVVSRTIHTQFGVLWIATAWLATGLYIAPLLSGREPKLQKLGVDLLFYALLFIVVGSTVCGWLGSLQHRGTSFAFWLGNQGLAYTSMGRVWQLLLFVGLLFWAFLLGRALMPALKDPKTNGRGIITMMFLSATCIGLFYASSLAWGQNTHYSMIEYWRWWLVHLWVEGFFEVFATAVIALIFSRLGLIRAATANRAIVMETIIFLFGGILGTLHHLYFTGTSTAIIAFGAVFSAFEVVPLAIMGMEGWQTYRRSHAAPWVQNYKWVILCFVAVSVWNTVGAGLLGFSINPPISLYYVQGLNITPAHGHAALFGVYGMLGIGLMLFCLRGMSAREAWDDSLLKPAFWMLNIGLFMMVFFSILPSGIYEAWACVSKGLWYARSPEVIHSTIMQTLVWVRVPGDIVFAMGVLYLGWFALRLLGRGPTAPQEAAAKRVTQRV